MIREDLTEEDCGLNSSCSISCSFPLSFFPSLISNWWNGILGNMPRRSFSILIAVWNFTFPAPLGNCSLRHAVFFSKFPCSNCLAHLCNIPFTYTPYNAFVSLKRCKIAVIILAKVIASTKLKQTCNTGCILPFSHIIVK